MYDRREGIMLTGIQAGRQTLYDLACLWHLRGGRTGAGEGFGQRAQTKMSTF